MNNKALILVFLASLSCSFILVKSPEKVVQKGLIVDLDADQGVVTSQENKVEKWINQSSTPAVKEFVKRDEGRKVKGSGRPSLRSKLAELNGHNTITFVKQELVAHDEDAFDHILTGSGYTWLCILKAGKQSGELKDVNSFFGNLKNGGNYEGIWGGLNDNNSIWMGSRNGITFGRWDNNNPKVTATSVLKFEKYYLLIGRMGKGTDTVMLSLYLNNGLVPVVSHPFPVNKLANSSKLAIGQERDAIEHPGTESFIGEISRFFLYDRPLSDQELNKTAKTLKKKYGIID
nr:LamG-like jellyroll fold domain-containing protein [Pedobacter panaciterrae]